MTEVALLAEDAGFEEWREAARAFLSGGVRPELIAWAGDGDLFANTAPPRASCETSISVPRPFVELAHSVALFRGPERFALLYRMLWRLQRERTLLSVATDPDVFRAQRMAQAVRRDKHKMTAFVRFRRIDTPEGEHFIAWYEPDHFVVEETAPFFVERFANMRWSILTPDKSVHWHNQTLSIGPGASRGQAPAEDAAEDDWRTYYASMFNTARLNLNQMRGHMPVRKWRNLPEASLISDLVDTAHARTAEMMRAQAASPRKRAGNAHAALRGDEKLAAIAAREIEPRSLKDISAALDSCRACPLWANATQGVPGEGPRDARIVFVGEQPGDQEDLQRKPFVGPAGQVLNSALDAAGIDRSEIFITNAVKHFKNQPRAKRRLHKRPNTSEIGACRWWLERELEIVKPDLIVALGASAMQSLTGYTGTMHAIRGKPMPSELGAPVLATVHPSYLLRIPDAASKAKELKLFVRDLKAAKAVLL